MRTSTGGASLEQLMTAAARVTPLELAQTLAVAGFELLPTGDQLAQCQSYYAEVNRGRGVAQVDAALRQWLVGLGVWRRSPTRPGEEYRRWLAAKKEEDRRAGGIKE